MVLSSLEHPTAKALRAQPSARRPPADRGGSVITEPRGARRPPACTHAVGPGTGKSGGGPYALATSIRSCSRAPSKPQGIRPGPRRRTCAMARGRAPVPGAGVTVLCSVWRAQAHAPGRSLCPPFSGVFQFLDRYISLARKIGYVTIKPMTNTARYYAFLG